MKLLGFLLLTGSLYAAPVTFDFESLGLGQYTTLSTTSGGVTMTVTRENNLLFSLADTSVFVPPGPATWGVRTLSPFDDTSASAFIFSFSSNISSFSIQLGDFDGDSDTWMLTGFSGTAGTGTNLGSTGGSWGLADIGTGDAPQTGTLNLSDMASVLVIGGSTDYPNSLYFDNVTIDTTSGVPEPAALWTLPMGLAALALLRRRLPRN